MSNLLEGTSLNGGLPTESIQLPMPGVEELNWWLNPDGSITEGGASPGPILPHGVSDTGFKCIFRVKSCFFPLYFKWQKARPDPKELL